MKSPSYNTCTNVHYFKVLVKSYSLIFSEFVSIDLHIPFVLLLCATRKILVITLHHTPHLTTLSAPSQNSPLSQEYNPY